MDRLLRVETNDRPSHNDGPKMPIITGKWLINQRDETIHGDSG